MVSQPTKKSRFPNSGRRVFVAFLISLVIHFFGAPRLLNSLLLEQPPEDIEVAYVTPEELANPPEPADLDKEKPKPPEKKKLPAKKPPEVAKAPELKPQPVKPVPPPPQQPPPPQPVLPKERMQMVDQQRPDDEKDNPNAKYLAQQNHKTEKETRMESTNLLRETQGAQKTSEPSENKLQEPGEAEQKIAELQERAGPDKTIPRTPLMQGNEGQENKEEGEAGPSSHDKTARSMENSREQAREGLERPEDEKGPMPLYRVGEADQRERSQRKGGEHVKLALQQNMYDQIEGYATAEAERQKAARGETSHKAGRYDRYLAKVTSMKSAIENFTPAVRPGNQAELGTRASPFAAYITGMHRQIHKLFTFGFLSDIELRSNSLYSDETLWTQLEIVINADGTVNRVGVVKSSGVLPFDAAAIDSVQSAGPFQKPPQAIKSVDGKVYLDWQFHRDERACGTFGVDPHILTSVAQTVDHDSSETGAASHAALKAHGGNAATGGGGALANLGTAGGGNGGGGAPVEAPRHLSRSSGEGGEGEESSSGGGGGEGTPTPVVTDAAKKAAEGWAAAYARGDVGWLAGWSAVPFSANGQIVARDPAALKKMFRALLDETKTRKIDSWDVLTPGGVRSRLGGLPPGGDDSMLYGMVVAGGEHFVLLMQNTEQGLRVRGIQR